jgi:PBP1b-binding outer membrane lipoprotein LpoB
MNKKLSAIALSALLIISGGCAQNDQQSKQNQQNKQARNTQQQKKL